VYGGKFGEARSHFRNAAALAGHWQTSVLAIRLCLSEQEKHKEALQALEAIAEEKPLAWPFIYIAKAYFELDHMVSRGGIVFRSLPVAQAFTWWLLGRCDMADSHARPRPIQESQMKMVILSTEAHLWLDIPWIFIVKETARGRCLT
jgi:hypothetical protein